VNSGTTGHYVGYVGRTKQGADAMIDDQYERLHRELCDLRTESDGPFGAQNFKLTDAGRAVLAEADKTS
jgi:hypothetical protein